MTSRLDKTLQRGRGLLALFMIFAVHPAHAVTSTWLGAGADFSWLTAENWSNGIPTATDDVFFTVVGATASPGTPNNIVAVDTSIQSLTLVNSNTAAFHTTLINPGVTLTVTNATAGNKFLAGNGAEVGAKNLTHFIQGEGGKLVVSAPLGTISIRQGSTSVGSRYTVDMSGLDNFSATVTRIAVAGDGFNRPGGTWLMAKTNTLLLGATTTGATAGWVIGNTTGSGGNGGIVSMGMTNGIFCDGGVSVGLLRVGDCQLHFNPSTAVGGTAYFRNRAGTGRQAAWFIGDGGAGAYSGNLAKGVVDFSNGSVDALVTQLVVGRSQTTAGGGVDFAGAQGFLTLAAGILDVNSALIGIQLVDNGAKTIGQVNVDGTAQLIVNNSVQLGQFKAALPVNGNSSAIINIGTLSGGGSVTIKGNITSTTNAASINDSEVRVRNGGSLSVGGSVGPLAAFELSQGTVALDFGSTPNPALPLCTTTELLTAAPLSVSLKGAGLFVGQFTLIKYQTLTGNGADDVTTFTLPPNIQGYLSNNLANSSIDFVVTNVAVAIWNGNLNGNWDINTTANWLDSANAPTTYQQFVLPGNPVVFNDSASGTPFVTLTTDLSPASITVSNSAKNYTFMGTGALVGEPGLNKFGPGTLTIANTGSNGFTGAISINDGTVRLSGSADRLPTNATVTLADATGAVLDLNNQNQTLGGLTGGGVSGGNVSLGSGTLTVGGGGTYGGVISGAGTFIKVNTSTMTLAGENLFNGGTLVTNGGRISVINPTGSGLGSGNITIQGGLLYIGSSVGGAGGAYGHVSAAAITNNLSDPLLPSSSVLYVNRSDDYNFNSVLYGSGQFYLGYGPGRVIIDQPNFHSGLSVSSFGPVRISHSNALGTGPMLLGGVAAAALEVLNDITVTNTLQLNCKGGALLQPANIINVSGTNNLAGRIEFLTGGSDWVFRSDAGKLILSGPLTNGLAATRNYWLRGDADGEVINGFPMGLAAGASQPTNNLTKNGLGTWTLWGNNTYNGSTIISDGTLLVNGSIIPAGPSANNTVQVNGGILGGTGQIATAVIVLPGATLSPGASGGSIGTLTLNSNLTLNAGSIAQFDVTAANGTVTSDKVQGVVNQINAGTLKVTLAGSVVGGEIFQLFNATSYSGEFDTFDLPTLTGSLSWDTTQLSIDGTLRVAGGANIQVGEFAYPPGGNFQMSGTSAATNAPYRIEATSNLSDPLSWVEVGSGSFINGTFSFSDSNSTNFPIRFYRIVTP